MTGQRNPTIGHIECQYCHGQADIRRASKGKKQLYLWCQCKGPTFGSTPSFQSYILEHGKIDGPAPAPVPKPDEKPAPEPAPVNKPPADPDPPKKRAWFDQGDNLEDL